MWWHCLNWETLTVAQNHSGNESCNPRRNVYNNTASKIHNPQFTQPAAAPYPVTYGCIYEDQPSGTEQDNRRKAHALSKAANDQCRCNDRKRHLKKRKNAFGNSA